MLRHESIFSDNYESDKLVFYSDHNIGSNCMKDDYEHYLLWLFNNMYVFYIF